MPDYLSDWKGGGLEGTTLADRKTYENLSMQFAGAAERLEGTGGTMSIADLIPGFTSGLSNIPIRTAVNAIEHFGGVVLGALREAGDVVCRAEDVPAVNAAIIESRRERVREILALVTDRPDDVEIGHDSHELERFLALYDQPLPDSVLGRLGIGEPEGEYRDADGHAGFELDYGVRSRIWADGCARSLSRAEEEMRPGRPASMEGAAGSRRRPMKTE